MIRGQRSVAVHLCSRLSILLFFFFRPVRTRDFLSGGDAAAAHGVEPTCGLGRGFPRSPEVSGADLLRPRRRGKAICEYKVK